MRAMILTAGFGKRLLPHTEVLAKPAIPFLGVPGLCFPLYLAEQLCPNRVLFNLHHLPETVKAAVQQVKSNDYEVAFSVETPNILDSGGGIKNAQPLLEGDGDFFVANGDTVLLAEDCGFLSQALKHHQTTNALATLIVQRHDNAGSSYGGVFAENGGTAITHFAKKKTDEKSNPYHYLGLALLSEKVFSFLPEGKSSNILYDGLMTAIASGENVQLFEAPKLQWFETGNPSDFLAAEKTCMNEVLKDGRFAQHLKSVLSRYVASPELDSWEVYLQSHNNPFPRLKLDH